MPKTSACDLFRRCVSRGASVDWHEFLRLYAPRIRTAIRRAFDRHGACLGQGDLEELFQELFCRLLVGAQRRRFRGRADVHLWAYLGQIAHSLAMDMRRAAHAHKRRMKVIRYNELQEDIADKLVTDEVSPEMRILEDERWRVFLTRCHDLLNGDRTLKVRALQLALRQGLTSRQVARRLGGGIRAEQVDQLIYRVRRRLAAEGIQVPCRRGGWGGRRRSGPEDGGRSPAKIHDPGSVGVHGRSPARPTGSTMAARQGCSTARPCDPSTAPVAAKRTAKTTC